MSITYKVAQKGFKSQNLLNINAVIASKEVNNNLYFDDIVYLDFSKGTNTNNVKSYDTNNKIAMKLDCFEFGAFLYACKEILKRKETSYVKYTEPGLANSSGAKKKLTLGLKDGTYFINIEEKEINKIGIGFTMYEFASFIDRGIKICEELDSTVFSYQRAADRNKQKAP